MNAIINQLASLVPLDGLHLISQAFRRDLILSIYYQPSIRSSSACCWNHLNHLWPLGCCADTPKKPHPRSDGSEASDGLGCVDPRAVARPFSEGRTPRETPCLAYHLLCRLQCTLRVTGVASHARLQFETAFEGLQVNDRFSTIQHIIPSCPLLHCCFLSSHFQSLFRFSTHSFVASSVNFQFSTFFIVLFTSFRPDLYILASLIRPSLTIQLSS
jgi:hypothetical protein